MRTLVAVLLAFSLLLPLPALAVDQADLMKKIDDLSKELEKLKQQMQEMQKQETVKEERITKVEKKADEPKGWPSWLEIGGDFRSRHDILQGRTVDYVQYDQFAPALGTAIRAPNFPVPGAVTTFLARPQQAFDAENDSLLTNRLRLDIKAKPTEDINFKGRLLMYKIWGHQTSQPTDGQFFADRAFGPFDGTIGHVPTDGEVRVDRAIVTWANIADQPIWLSVGRRPSTNGPPSHLRMNEEKEGTAGIPCFLVDYAFDGASFGVQPEIPGLPGAYAKL